MPKKPMTAYFLWLNEEGREEIKKEKPGLAVTEVAKAAGEKWKEIDEDTKKKYEDKHKEMKEKYDEEYKEWKKKKVAAEVTGGSGGGFQSKEFMEDSESNDNDSD